jgi:hypothetical protein
MFHHDMADSLTGSFRLAPSTSSFSSTLCSRVWPAMVVLEIIAAG